MGKKVFLLGAGAAFLYGAPSTKEITQSLSGLCKFNNAISKRLISYLGEDAFTFETLLSALEYIITFMEQKGKCTYHYSFQPALSSLKCRFHSRDVKRVYLESLNQVINLIVPYTQNREASKDEMVFRHFTNADENHVYSLNYDRIIPSIFEDRGVAFSDGTVNGSVLKQSIKDFVASPNTFFNVHGNIYLYQSPISLYDIFQGDEPSTIKSLYPLNGGNPRERTYFTPIISGYSKTQHILSKPFSFGVSSLAIDLQDCDELEIIGYSFSDSHINGLINSFFDFRNKPLTVVDYFPKQHLLEQIDDLQDELSSFYKTRPDFYNMDGSCLVYKHHPLTVFTDGVEKYLDND